MAAAALLTTSIHHHFQKYATHARAFYDIIYGHSPLSLRVIDWFVTHYAKAFNVCYWIDEEGRMHETLPKGLSPSEAMRFRKFHLYFEYRAQLRSFTKMLFDPFRRHARMTFVVDKSPLLTMETTLGQLNFFRWAILHHVLTYIQHHLPEIEQHMSDHQHSKKDATEDGPTTTAVAIKNHTASASKASSSHAAPPSRAIKVAMPGVVRKNDANNKIQTACYVRFD